MPSSERKKLAAQQKSAVQRVPQGLTPMPSPQVLQSAMANPHRARPETILALQRTVGNQAVQRMITQQIQRNPEDEEQQSQQPQPQSSGKVKIPAIFQNDKAKALNPMKPPAAYAASSNPQDFVVLSSGVRTLKTSIEAVRQVEKAYNEAQHKEQGPNLQDPSTWEDQKGQLIDQPQEKQLGVEETNKITTENWIPDATIHDENDEFAISSFNDEQPSTLPAPLANLEPKIVQEENSEFILTGMSDEQVDAMLEFYEQEIIQQLGQNNGKKNYSGGDNDELALATKEDNLPPKQGSQNDFGFGGFEDLSENYSEEMLDLLIEDEETPQIDPHTELAAQFLMGEIDELPPRQPVQPHPQPQPLTKSQKFFKALNPTNWGKKKKASVVDELLAGPDHSIELEEAPKEWFKQDWWEPEARPRVKPQLETIPEDQEMDSTRPTLTRAKQTKNLMKLKAQQLGQGTTKFLENIDPSPEASLTTPLSIPSTLMSHPDISGNFNAVETGIGSGVASLGGALDTLSYGWGIKKGVDDISQGYSDYSNLNNDQENLDEDQIKARKFMATRQMLGGGAKVGKGILGGGSSGLSTGTTISSMSGASGAALTGATTASGVGAMLVALMFSLRLGRKGVKAAARLNRLHALDDDQEVMGNEDAESFKKYASNKTKNKLTRAVGGTVGALAGGTAALATLGLMATPAGWALAGGSLLAALALGGWKLYNARDKRQRGAAFAAKIEAGDEWAKMNKEQQEEAIKKQYDKKGHAHFLGEHLDKDDARRKLYENKENPYYEKIAQARWLTEEYYSGSSTGNKLIEALGLDKHRDEIDGDKEVCYQLVLEKLNSSPF